MKPISLLDFAGLCGGALVGGSPDTVATGFATDNREVKPGDLFLAIKGEHVDGHDFSADSFLRGAVAALVERPVSGPYVLVPNLVGALASYAGHIRDGFSGPVIGITGSAGKTTTKEFIAAALSPLGPVLKTAGNRNSEYTSPLMWAELEPEHKAVVVEMGMRGFGQVRHLAAFSRPTIGVITNIGFSHLAQVKTREGIAFAKGELFDSLPPEGHAVLWAEDPFTEFLSMRSRAPAASYGFSEKADCRITEYKVDDWRSCFLRGSYNGAVFTATLPAAGRHLALNAAAAVLVAALAGVPVQAAAAALSDVKIPPMRMEIVEFNGATIVLDAYNAAPPSVIAALETLADVPGAGRKYAVLGQMRELGDYAEEGHRSVGKALAAARPDRVLLFGEDTHWIGEEAVAFGLARQVVASVRGVEEISEFIKGLKPGDTVLIKGSRALELERALDFLKEPVA